MTISQRSWTLRTERPTDNCYRRKKRAPPKEALVQQLQYDLIPLEAMQMKICRFLPLMLTVEDVYICFNFNDRRRECIFCCCCEQFFAGSHRTVSLVCHADCHHFWNRPCWADTIYSLAQWCMCSAFVALSHSVPCWGTVSSFLLLLSCCLHMLR